MVISIIVSSLRKICTGPTLVLKGLISLFLRKRNQRVPEGKLKSILSLPFVSWCNAKAYILFSSKSSISMMYESVVSSVLIL